MEYKVILTKKKVLSKEVLLYWKLTRNIIKPIILSTTVFVVRILKFIDIMLITLSYYLEVHINKPSIGST